MKTNIFGLSAIISIGIMAASSGCGSSKKSSSPSTDGNARPSDPAAIDTIFVSESQEGNTVKISYTSNDSAAEFECKVELQGQPSANWDTCPRVAQHVIVLKGSGTHIVQIRASVKKVVNSVETVFKDASPIERRYNYQEPGNGNGNNGNGNNNGNNGNGNNGDVDYCDDNGQYDNGQYDDKDKDYDNGQYDSGQYDNGQYDDKGKGYCDPGQSVGKDYDNGQYDNGQYDDKDKDYDNGQYDNGQYDDDKGTGYEDAYEKDDVCIVTYTKNGELRERRVNSRHCRR